MYTSKCKRYPHHRFPHKLLLLNPNSPARLPSHRYPTSSDLTIAYSHMALDLEWRIIVTYQTLSNWEVLSKWTSPSHLHYSEKGRLGLTHSWSGEIVRSTRVTFLLQHEWASVLQNPKLFRKTPHPLRLHPNMIHNLTEITKQLIVERDALRTSFHTEPHLHELHAQIPHIADYNSWKLTLTVESCPQKYNPSRLSGIIKFRLFPT